LVENGQHQHTYKSVENNENKLLVPYTVKPVYNRQPWDSEKVAVVEKVVVSCRFSYKIPISFGKLGNRPAIVNRWPLFRVGR
jgi:hypothetical protein